MRVSWVCQWAEEKEKENVSAMAMLSHCKKKQTNKHVD